MKKVHLALAATVVLTVGLTEAYPATNGSDLMELCEERPSSANYYIGGVLDVYRDRDLYDALPTQLKFCPPKGVSYRQMIDVTCKWLKDTPKDRHLDGPTIVSMALSEAWPCAR